MREPEGGRQRVVVAMSGGVDSAVAAGLLAEAGHEVIGITLQLYDHGQATAKRGACCAGRDIADARQAAERLGLPHYVLDFEERFRRAVIDDFADSYARGLTPVPCVRCNQRIKFGELMGIARELGAQALATGHYAERRLGQRGPELHRGRDPAKDQSYFLFATTGEQLDYLRLPLGTLSKAETRRHAERLGLALAEKAESQDICFVPTGHYSRLVERLRPEAFRPGEIVDEAGRTLGRHQGVGRFTVGQRRGLGLARPEPLYVTGLDPERAQVVVGARGAGARTGFDLREANWLDEAALSNGGSVEVKHRYNEPAVPARISIDAGSARVELEAPQAGIAPGQAAVVYAGSRVLGGGWIERDPIRPGLA